MKKIKIEPETLLDILEGVETTERYDGYYYSIKDALVIVILGSICGLQNTRKIHQWAESEKVSEFLKEKFGIERIPCYYWLLSLLNLVDCDSLNRCLMKWAESLLPEEKTGLTISIDGKTVCSTQKMSCHESALHIVSAQVSELGITLASKSVAEKSNEIPAVQELIRELNIEGCLVTADALNCQRDTAKAIVERKGDYLLDAKANQPELMKAISEYFEVKSLWKDVSTKKIKEKNRNRIEIRTAYATADVDWMPQKGDWENLSCIGAIKTEFERNGEKSEEWHYYLSSRVLTASELLHHARMEWAVESMHWLLDVHYAEDSCRLQALSLQRNLNMLRKFALSMIKQYKAATSSGKALSQIMFDCLLDCNKLLSITQN